MKCKVFTGYSNTVGDFANNINDWLEDNPDLTILFVTQSAVHEYTTVTIFYEE